PPEAGDYAEASGWSAFAAAMGGGLGLASRDRALGIFAVEGLALSSYVAALAVAPRTRFEPRDAGTVAAGMATFGWLGAWVPSLVDGDATLASQHAGGAAFGAGLGGALGLVWSLVTDARHEAETLVWTSLASGAGGGLSLLADAPDGGLRQTSGLLLGTGLAGLATGLVVSPHTEYTAGDRALAGLGAAVGAGVGATVPGLFSDRSARRVGGGALFGASAGVLSSLALSPFVDPSPGDVLELSAFTFASSLIGGGLAVGIVEDDGPASSAALLTSGGAGLALGAAVAPHTRYDGSSVGTVALGTAVGAASGGWVPSLFDASATAREGLGAATVGAGVGSLAGVLLSQVAPRTGGEQGEIALGSVLGQALGGGATLVLDDPTRTDLAGLMVGFGLSSAALSYALAPVTRYEGLDGALVGMTGLVGALHGGLLAPTFTPAGDEVGDRQIGGGVLLGTSAGLVLGAGLAQVTDLGAGGLALGGSAWATMAMTGGGLSLMLPSLSRPEAAGLIQGLGLGGYAFGLAVGDRLELDAGDPGLIALTGVVGTSLGVAIADLTGGGADEDPSAEQVGGGLLVGTGAGLATGLALTQLIDVPGGDVLESAALTANTAGMALGLGLLIPGSDARTNIALVNGGTVAGLGLGLLLAPRLELGPDTAANLSLGAALGAGWGSLVPVYVNGPDLGAVPGRQLGGGLLFGATAGLAGALVLDQTVELDATAREGILLGAASGALSGAGLGLATSTDDRVLAGLLHGLSLSSSVLVGATLDDVDVDAGDVALGTAWVSFLSWHSLGTTLLLDGSDRQAAGVLMATAGLGTLNGLYLRQLIDPGVPETVTVLAGSLWGAWLGGWTGSLLNDGFDGNDRQRVGAVMTASAVGADAGGAAAAVAVATLSRLATVRFAVVNGSGLAGLAAGVLTAAFVDADERIGILAGSAGGLALGAVVTAFMDFSKTPSWDDILGRRDVDRPSRGRAVADARELRTPRAAPLVIESWIPSAQVLPGDEANPDASTYLFSIRGTWH
ncbi:MAG TPA: hypothetical protein RMF84_07040, partial [Polyangiaceae bacterium LLY-WYZ-14_1]|nr:hypothetical protein [Polyangiaceae bacterium LLY-WYZ-14_1]